MVWDKRDVIVYNMGDHLPFHGEIHAVSQRHPGIVILHDRVLHHLFAGLWLNGPKSARHIYIDRMETFYGARGAEVAKASLADERLPIWESDEDVLDYPLYEEALKYAIGTVTHSEGQARDVRDRWLGPASAAASPVLRRGTATSGRPRRHPSASDPTIVFGCSPSATSIQTSKPTVLSRSSRRTESSQLVSITPSSGRPDDFHSYVTDLRQRVRRRPDRCVDILGWRDDHEFERLMAQADVFINLRQPVMEGARVPDAPARVRSTGGVFR